jgi:hypothetical protein
VPPRKFDPGGSLNLVSGSSQISAGNAVIFLKPETTLKKV